MALPDGSFVVVWVADRNGESGEVLRSATRSPAGTWTTEDVRDLSPAAPRSSASRRARTAASWSSPWTTGASVSNTKPSASAPWGGAQTVGIGTVDGFAVGPDGGTVAVGTGVCSDSACIRASYRPSGGDWGEQETVGITERVSVLGLAVTANPDGSATAVWAVASDDGEVVEPPGDVLSADRTAGPGGTWGAAPDSVAHLESDTPDCDLRCVDIATGADGAQLAVWPQSGEGGDQIAAALRSAGGGWVGPETVGGTVGNDVAARGDHHVRRPRGGVELERWTTARMRNGSHRDAAGAWHPVLLGSSQDDSVSLGDLDPDGDGNALTGFRHRGGVFTSGFDGGGPRFSGFSVPAAGDAGETLDFSAAAEDNWSGVTGISWLFGDGGTASGGAVTHVYGAGGEFNATATATDGVGNASQSTGTTVVTGGPTASPSDPIPAAPPIRTRTAIKDGCDDNNGAARPVPFKTVNATVVSGDVFVKLPAGAARASQGQAAEGLRPARRRRDDPGRRRSSTPPRAGSGCGPRPTPATTCRRPTSSAAASSCARSASRAARPETALDQADHGHHPQRLVVPARLPHYDRLDLPEASPLQEARAAALRRRQGHIPYQGPQRRGDGPGDALERPGPL